VKRYEGVERNKASKDSITGKYLCANCSSSETVPGSIEDRII